MSSVNSETFWLSGLALLGAGVGVYLFFYGFRILRYKRLILNTPFSKIRSASMGLVEITGTPTGPKTIAAAITGTPCYYYRARAWIWLDSGKGGHWEPVQDQSVHVPFFLEDGTGRVLVNPQGATLDVHRSFYDEFRTSPIGKDSGVPDSIRKFLALCGLTGGWRKVRLEENIIQPGFPLFVFGTLGENTIWNWNAQPHVASKKISLSFGLGDSVNLNFTRTATMPDLAAKALSGLLASTSGMNTRTSTYVSRSDGGPVELPEDVLKTLQQAGVNLPFPVLAAAGKMTVSSRSSGSGPPRLNSNSMQVAIAAEPPGAVTEATAKQTGSEEKPSSADFNLRAPVAIGKGERGDPFTISSQSQREVVQSLGWKAMACIWGGPVFALVCLRCLFVFWGWM